MAGYLPEYLISSMDQLDEHPWLFAGLASVLVGLSGIFPMLVIPLDSTDAFNDGPGAATLKTLLSFAVGGLLGDVFLHLLPEAWENDMRNTKPGEHVTLRSGLWCLCGMLVFIIVEKLFAATEDHEDHEDHEEHAEAKTNGVMKNIEIEEIEKLLDLERKQRGKGDGEGICGENGTVTAKQLYDTCVFNNNSNGGCCNSVSSQNEARCKGNRWMGRCILREAREKALKTNKEKTETKKDVAGYLNLMANSIDNFTHGLAVGGSFLVGFRVGVLTTFAILVHEIPHEVGDFAILLKSGFSRWEAAKAQLATAAAGLIGAMTAVIFSGAKNSIEAKTSWIVPFTAGGFLHIALVTVLPELLRERRARAALQQLAALCAGVLLLAALRHYCG